MLLTIVSRLDDLLLRWKLAPYLETSLPKNDETRKTITHIVVGAISLSSFLANSLIFITNLLLGLSLYEAVWVRLLVSFLVLLCVFALFYGALAIAIRQDIVDIAEHKIKGSVHLNLALDWTDRVQLDRACLGSGLACG